MEILTQIQEQLQQHPGTGSSIVLAQALAAACHESYGVSLLAAASVLDSSNARPTPTKPLRATRRWPQSRICWRVSMRSVFMAGTIERIRPVV